jgi:hypothetical protein
VEFLSDDLNRIIRFENFHQEVSEILLNIGIQPDSIQKLGSTNHTKYTDYYDSGTADIVAAIYQSDIECFNYKFV